MIQLLRTDCTNNHFRLLVSKLDKELSERYGELQNKYHNFNNVDSCNTVVIAKYDNLYIGCGCYKKYDDQTAEIKRMFVDPNYRGLGVSKQILIEIENWARENGYKNALLETMMTQINAIGLYKKTGYTFIENYGQYIGMEKSICMKKQIA